MSADRAWVVLLRGINVGGHRRVPMARLRQVCEDAGLTAVRTYIASGNLLCRSTLRTEQTVSRLVADLVRQEFGFDVDIVVRAGTRLTALEPAFDDLDHLHVGFLVGEPDAAAVGRARAALLNGAELVVDGDHLQLLTPGGLGRPFIRGDLERLLGVAATLRNWRTVTKLAAMVGA